MIFLYEKYNEVQSFKELIDFVSCGAKNDYLIELLNTANFIYANVGDDGFSGDAYIIIEKDNIYYIISEWYGMHSTIESGKESVSHFQNSINWEIKEIEFSRIINIYMKGNISKEVFMNMKHSYLASLS